MSKNDSENVVDAKDVAIAKAKEVVDIWLNHTGVSTESDRLFLMSLVVGVFFEGCRFELRKIYRSKELQRIIES